MGPQMALSHDCVLELGLSRGASYLLLACVGVPLFISEFGLQHWEMSNKFGNA